MNPLRGGWLIFVTLLAAMVANIAHLPAGVPEWLALLRPDWLLAVAFFWSFTASERTGMVHAWLLGLAMDALLGDPLGLNGACMAGAVYVGRTLDDRLRLYSLVQITAIALAIFLVAAALRELVRVWALGTEFSPWFLAPPALTAALFPFLTLLLRALTRRFRVR